MTFDAYKSQSRRIVLWLAALLLLALACAVPIFTTPAPLPTAIPTLTSTATGIFTSTPLPPDTGWQVSSSGLEFRSLDVSLPGGLERVTVVRVDPTRFTLQLEYLPQVPMTVSAWENKAGGLLVVNAGYFTQENVLTGLFVLRGRPQGVSYADFAGMVAVRDDGDASVRWLREWHYDADEPLAYAVQSFPVLVKPGGVMGFPADGDDGRLARRTVIAQDRAGQLLFLIAPRGYFNLHQLAVWLVDSDLDVDIALNLDGGASAGLWLAEETSAQIDSFAQVPAVLQVVER